MSDATQQRCPQCTAPVEPGQEYCLECGQRLTGEPAASAGPVSPERNRGWIGPAFLALIIAALGAGASIALSSNGETAEAISTAIGGSITITATGPVLTAPEPAKSTTTKTTATPAPPKPANPAFATWPRPQRGWTIVLISLPQNGGRAAAEEKADEARDGGLRRVGVIDSSRYASLHPGYYVVFTGIFETQTEAVSALQRAKAVFASAYVREIVP